MIMPRGQQLLLPANPLFVFLSLAFAMLLDMIFNMSLTGNAQWMPDFLAVVILSASSVGHPVMSSS